MVDLAGDLTLTPSAFPSLLSIPHQQQQHHHYGNIINISSSSSSVLTTRPRSLENHCQQRATAKQCPSSTSPPTPRQRVPRSFWTGPGARVRWVGNNPVRASPDWDNAGSSLPAMKVARGELQARGEARGHNLRRGATASQQGLRLLPRWVSPAQRPVDAGHKLRSRGPAPEAGVAGLTSAHCAGRAAPPACSLHIWRHLFWWPAAPSPSELAPVAQQRRLTPAVNGLTSAAQGNSLLLFK